MEQGHPKCMATWKKRVSVVVGEVDRICILKPSRESPHLNAAFKSVMHYFPFKHCNITLLCVCPRSMIYMPPGK